MSRKRRRVSIAGGNAVELRRTQKQRATRGRRNVQNVSDASCWCAASITCTATHVAAYTVTPPMWCTHRMHAEKQAPWFSSSSSSSSLSSPLRDEEGSFNCVACKDVVRDSVPPGARTSRASQNRRRIIRRGHTGQTPCAHADANDDDDDDSWG